MGPQNYYIFIGQYGHVVLNLVSVSSQLSVVMFQSPFPPLIKAPYSLEK